MTGPVSELRLAYPNHVWSGDFMQARTQRRIVTYLEHHRALFARMPGHARGTMLVPPGGAGGSDLALLHKGGLYIRSDNGLELVHRWAGP